MIELRNWLLEQIEEQEERMMNNHEDGEYHSGRLDALQEMLVQLDELDSDPPETLEALYLKPEEPEPDQDEESN